MDAPELIKGLQKWKSRLKMLKYLGNPKVILGILIAILVWMLTVATIHFFIFLKKDVNRDFGPVGVCPYNYDSLGLNESQTPIIGTMVDKIVGVVYANNNGQASGVLKNYRNNILNNQRFQAVKIFIIILIIAINGVSFTFGFSQMTSGDLLKKMGIIGLFLWATESGTYALYDQFIEPLVLRGTKQLTAFVANSTLNVIKGTDVLVYISSNTNNEFAVMDAALKIVFSKALFNKLGALIFTDAAYLFLGPSFYIIGGVLAFHFFMFAVTVIFYWLVIVIGLSIFPIFVLFGVLKAAGKSLDTASEFFSRYLQEALIKPAISIALLTYLASFLAAMIINYIAGAFTFRVCIKNYWSPPFVLSFIGNFDYFIALKPLTLNDIMGTIVAFDFQADDQVQSILANNGNTDVLHMMIFPNFCMVIFMLIIFKPAMQFMTDIAHNLNLGSALEKATGGFKSIAESAVSTASGAISSKVGDLLKGGGKEHGQSGRGSVAPGSKSDKLPPGSSREFGNDGKAPKEGSQDRSRKDDLDQSKKDEKDASDKLNDNQSSSDKPDLSDDNLSQEKQDEDASGDVKAKQYGTSDSRGGIMASQRSKGSFGSADSKIAGVSARLTQSPANILSNRRNLRSGSQIFGALGVDSSLGGNQNGYSNTASTVGGHGGYDSSGIFSSHSSTAGVARDTPQDSIQTSPTPQVQEQQHAPQTPEPKQAQEVQVPPSPNVTQHDIQDLKRNSENITPQVQEQQASMPSVQSPTQEIYPTQEKVPETLDHVQQATEQLEKNTAKVERLEETLKKVEEHITGKLQSAHQQGHYEPHPTRDRTPESITKHLERMKKSKK